MDGRYKATGKLATLDAGARRRALRAGGVAGKAAAKEAAPYSSGKLHRSIRYTASGGQLEIYSDAPYARVIEEGSGPLKIGPALMRFFWQNQGRMFTGPPSDKYPDNYPEAKYNWPAVVTRPPIEPNPFLRPALKVAQEAIIDQLKSEF